MNTTHFPRRLAVLACALALPATSPALEFDALGTTFYTVNALSIGAAIRLEDPDPSLYGIANKGPDGTPGTLYSTNSDDGNLSFEKGDLIGSAIKLTSRLEADWNGWGISVRGSGLYDPTLYEKDYFDAEDYVGAPTREVDADDLRRKRDTVQSRVGLDADLLEGYIYGGFDIGDHYLGLRVGKQVINWGESTFIQHGLNSLISADTSQLRVPGWELEEVYIPAGMVVGSIGLTDNISVEAFYQFEWQATQIDPVGTFFSTNDFVGPGGELAEIGFGRCPEYSRLGTCVFSPGGSSVPRGKTNEASDGGQGGGSLSIFVDAFGGVDMSLYAANFHSRLPLISGRATQAGFEGIPASAEYFIEYPEDIKLYGLSFNTQLPFGGIALSGEYSLKQDQPLQIDEVETLIAGLRTPLPAQIGPYAPGEYIQAWRRHDVSQYVLAATKIIGPLTWLGTDQILLLFESGATQVHDFPSTDELRYEGPNTVQPGDPVVAAAVGVPVQPGGYAEEFSWGYRAVGRFTYTNVLNRFNLEPTLVFAHDVNGTAPLPVSNFVEDRKQLTVRIDATYLNAWTLRLAYSNYYGGGVYNQISDRDNVAISASYSF